MRFLAVAVSMGCGRINFDPLTSPNDGNLTPNDGTPIVDDGSPSDGSTTPLGPGGENCDDPTDLAFGTSGTASMEGATDDFNPLLPECADGPEITYRVTAPASGNYRVTMSPTFNATLIFTRGCPPPGGSCQTVISGQTFDSTPFFQAGSNFIIIERTGGAGITFSLELHPL